MYEENSNLYIFSKESFLSTSSRIGKNPILFETPKNEAIDIDTNEEWEMAEYVNLAKKNGYKVHSIVVENRHGSESIHDVPEATMQAMEDRFDIKLY